MSGWWLDKDVGTPVTVTLDQPPEFAPGLQEVREVITINVETSIPPPDFARDWTEDLLAGGGKVCHMSTDEIHGFLRGDFANDGKFLRHESCPCHKWSLAPCPGLHGHAPSELKGYGRGTIITPGGEVAF